LTARLTVDRDLGHAIESNQLELYLQPICDLQNRSATGAEAVIRWHHPRLGVLPPAEILEATHRARRVEELSAWTLDQACALATKMSAMGLGPISINTSARELASPNFAQMVLGTLQRHQLPVSQLILEVTETVIIDNADVMFTLSDLADAGISIALDDFGAGFSSLNHLRLVPAEIVKLDRSYVADLEDHRTAAIVRAIVDLAKALGQSVIAEGVESETQLTKLLELGVQRGQGILFGQPEPADAFFESLVRA
jgi:diguanylate cyclase